MLQWCTSGDPLHFIAHNGLLLFFGLLGLIPMFPVARAWAREQVQSLKGEHNHGHDKAEGEEGSG